MRGDEELVVHAFTRWLEDAGWSVRVHVDHCDVVADRGPERLYAEAKGETTSHGLDVDTLYGQLLRRMAPGADHLTRYGVVVRPSCRQHALRVPDHIRSELRIDVYLVSDAGAVEVIVGAELIDPVDAHSMGETLAWYDTHEPRAAAEKPIPSPLVGYSEETEDDDADALIDGLVATLSDRSAALTPSDLRAMDRFTLAHPGLYSWWSDDAGAADLARGLGHPVAPGLIYAGQAGATRWPSGKPSVNTLRGRLVGMHLGGRANLSTFRLTLAAILCAGWDGVLDEDRLTAWMETHLAVIPVPIADADPLGVVEEAVLARLDPPLNLQHMPKTPLRRELSRLRKALG